MKTIADKVRFDSVCPVRVDLQSSRSRVLGFVILQRRN